MAKKWFNKKLFMTVHTYTGLFCAGFLVLFGLTGFLFQHSFDFTKPNQDNPIIWEAHFSTEIEDQGDLKKAIRDSLGLFGHLPWWLQHTDSLGHFHFTLARPAKEFKIIHVPELDKVKVTETRTGVWNALFGVHSTASGGLVTPVLMVWKHTSHILAWLSLFTILSSVFIWRPKNQKRLYNWILFGGTTTAAILLILFVWLIG